MLEQMALHAPQVIRATSTQDLDPWPLVRNDYPSVLPHEMYALEPGDIPSRILSWKALGFLSHVKRRSNRVSNRLFWRSLADVSSKVGGYTGT